MEKDPDSKDLYEAQDHEDQQLTKKGDIQNIRTILSDERPTTMAGAMAKANAVLDRWLAPAGCVEFQGV